MAADTKRGAPEYVQIDLGGYHAPVSVRVDVLREQLAGPGLHVVTAAEKAVLDACAAFTLNYWEGCGPGISGDELKRVIDAELARREASK